MQVRGACDESFCFAYFKAGEGHARPTDAANVGRQPRHAALLACNVVVLAALLAQPPAHALLNQHLRGRAGRCPGMSSRYRQRSSGAPPLDNAVHAHW